MYNKYRHTLRVRTGICTVQVPYSYSTCTAGFRLQAVLVCLSANSQSTVRVFLLVVIRRCVACRVGSCLLDAMALLGLDCVVVLITFFLSFKLSAPISLSHRLVNGLMFVLPLNSKELEGLEPPKHKRRKKNSDGKRTHSHIVTEPKLSAMSYLDSNCTDHFDLFAARCRF